MREKATSYYLHAQQINSTKYLQPQMVEVKYRQRHKDPNQTIETDSCPVDHHPDELIVVGVLIIL